MATKDYVLRCKLPNNSVTTMGDFDSLSQTVKVAKKLTKGIKGLRCCIRTPFNAPDPCFSKGKQLKGR